MTPLVSVLMPTFGDLPLVRLSLPRILERSRCRLEALLVNNDERQSDAMRDLVAELDDPRVRVLELEHGAGFARALNRGIDESRGDLVFFANSDLFVGAGYLDELARFLERRGAAGCAAGKILRYDLTAGRETAVIDTTGHTITRSRRVSDRGENQRDAGQYEREEEVFGVSGAALVARRAALDSVRVSGEYLDESFHMYKEDVDLCWRLRLLGWECWYVPTAVAYHVRTSHGLAGSAYLGAVRAFHANEQRKPGYVRMNSMKNQWLMLVKNDAPSSLVRDLPFVVGRESLVLAYNLAFAPRTAAAALHLFFRALPGALDKRRAIKRMQVVRPTELRRWFGRGSGQARR